MLVGIQADRFWWCTRLRLKSYAHAYLGTRRRRIGVFCGVLMLCCHAGLYLYLEMLRERTHRWSERRQHVLQMQKQKDRLLHDQALLKQKQPLWLQDQKMQVDLPQLLIELEEQARQQGMRLLDYQPLATVQEGATVSHSFRLQLTATLHALGLFLAQILSASTSVFLDDMALSQVQEGDLLNIELTLYHVTLQERL